MTFRPLRPAITAITSTAVITAALISLILILYTAPGASGDQQTPPLTIAGPQTLNHQENTTQVAQYAINTATGQTILWYLEGDDSRAFTITEGNLAFNNAPDFEKASDNDADNSYQVTLIATATRDHPETATLAVTVTVQNVNEPPTPDTQTTDVPIILGETTQGDLKDLFQDPEGDTLSFTITAPRDSGLNARLEGSQLTLTASGENRKTSITVEANDGLKSSTLSITLTITGRAFPPSAPTNLQAQPTEDGFILTWNEPEYLGDNGIQAHAIDYRIAGTTSQFTTETHLSSSRTYRLTNLQPGTPYEIRVVACHYRYTFLGPFVLCGPHATINATTLAANNPPVITSPAQDWYFNPNDNPATIDLSHVFHDTDGDTLTYQAVSSDTTIATAAINGSTLTLSPIDLGAATITLTAKDRPDTDPDQMTASDTFTATVDYLPAITITPQHAERTEGEELRFTLTADPAPSRNTEVKICVSQGNADYLTDTTPSSMCDIAGPIDHITNRVLAKIGFPHGSTNEELILQTEDDNVSENNATITATILRTPGNPYTAGRTKYHASYDK